MSDAQPPIWDFVLGYYRQQGVSEGAITLQDQLGLDVNMVLFLMWLAGSKRVLSEADIKKTIDAAKGWQHQVVVPIRGVRRLLKENAPLVEQEAALAYRKKVQALEIEGEQLQLLAMGKLSEGMSTTTEATAADAARKNLAGLSAAYGKPFPQAAVDGFVNALKAQVNEK